MPMYQLSLEERKTCPTTCEQWSNCFVPGTPILTMNLDWVPVENLLPGDKIAGFDEHPKGGECRKTKSTVVEKVQRITQPCYTLSTTEGNVTVSAGHLWLARRGRPGYKWTQTANLKVGDDLPFFTKPWVQDLSYNAARLRGFVEGEGTLGTGALGKWRKARVSWAQKKGVLQREIDAVAKSLGFNITTRKAVSGVINTDMRLTDVLGGWRSCMEFMGRIKPTRLMLKAKELYEGHSLVGKGSKPAIVTAIIPVGNREVIGVKTCTNTMVASGLFTHNCYGNNMPFANRIDHTHPLFFQTLTSELKFLSTKHASGFVVRLHVLGDFFSVKYVKYWERKLRELPSMRLFGYTHQRGKIGEAIEALNQDRCWIRFSDRGGPMSANVNGEGIQCPEQTGKTESCLTCALCWSHPQPIKFLGH